MPSYLETLTTRLMTGLAEEPEESRQTTTDFLRSRQQTDGGFAGREGPSDLYYTGFGLRGLAILGQLDKDAAERAAGFLAGRLTGRESIVDFYSLIYSAKLIQFVYEDFDVLGALPHGWRLSIADALSKLRRDDGGYAKGPEGQASSTYHTFLVLLTLELIEAQVLDADQVVSFVRSQKMADGGFREIRVSRRCSTNPTAAAVGCLQILDATDDELIKGVGDFLSEMQMEDGGFRANTRIPIADLLSTFTSLVTLHDLNEIETISLDETRRFVRSLHDPAGGYYGAEWDSVVDVEYTFYGLGAQAMLNLNSRH